ncbi:MAG: sensory histidine kinase AtoS [Methanoregula sp. PtaU1.Bin051]|nr:MAG: sensory histidine kinase AtoS [Methanoregula sp. PtaU1.Bin051]
MVFPEPAEEDPIQADYGIIDWNDGKKPMEIQAVQDAALPGYRKSISVLYVDDDPDLLDICKLFLEESGGILVDTIPLAPQALERLASARYDAIVSDYQMPGMDGIAFLKEIRARFGTVPFILFTGRGREEVVIEAYENGADLYLQKGGDPGAQFTELERKIRLVVDQRRIRTELVESQQRVADIIDFLPDATFAIDLEGRVIAWNRAIENLTGIPKEGIMGAGSFSYALPFYGERRPILIDLVLRESRETEEKYQNLRRKCDKVIADAYVRSCNGKSGICLWAIASPLRDSKGRIVGAIESIRDVTDQKQIEESLRQTNKKFNLLNNITCHDILNQLTALLGYLDLTGERLTDPETRGFLENVILAADKIQSLIRFSRYYHDLGADAPEWQNLREVCMKAIHGCEGVTVAYPPGDLDIYADPMLEKVIYVLFDNALCHGKHVTEITFCLKEPEPGNGVTIVMEDNGAGIPDDEKEKIFGRGYVRDSSLCLFLVREILLITGITIRETGTWGKGARFEIRVPPGGFRFISSV